MKNTKFGAVSALATSTVVVAQVLPEREYCINPWQQVNDGDALVKLSDILMVGFILSPPQPESPNQEDWSWLEVWTSDGRLLTTELACNQDDVYELHATLTHGMESRKKVGDWYTLYKPVGALSSAQTFTRKHDGVKYSLLSLWERKI